jgi:alpha-D-ribose 1-methylphosphonate 5-triphosphate synthase subunit PhnH
LITEINIPTTQWPGFLNPVLGPQKTFRAIIEAMARPGQLIRIKCKVNRPEMLNLASAAVCLTLLDDETPLWTDLSWNCSAVNWFQVHCGCSLVTEPCMADFALITRPADMPPLDDFRIGNEQHPESAATLIVEVEGFNDANGKVLGMPGIKPTTHFAPEGIAGDFWEQWQLQAAFFPLGVDILFTCGDRLAALPRTTELCHSTPRTKKTKKRTVLT